MSTTDNLFPPLSPERHVTPEEVMESFEFQTIKRIIKREYPWVIDLILTNDSFLNRYEIVFLTVIINPYILQKQTGWEILPYTLTTIARGEWARGSSINYIFNISEETGKQIDNELTQIAKDVSESPHLPDDLKYLAHKQRKYWIQTYMVPPDTDIPIPDDVIVSEPDFPFDMKWYITFQRQHRKGG